jgi:hypothetical protein
VPRAVEPRPLKQHQVKTVMLRVPTPAWPAVSSGRVSEFRAALGNTPRLWKVPMPTLALAYRRRAPLDYDYRLVVLEGLRQEALGAITDEGLAAAGYTGSDALSRFRREWCINEHRRFEPLRRVMVFTVRLASEDDFDALGHRLLQHLYGDYIVQEAHVRSRSIKAIDPRESASGRGEIAQAGTG